MAARPLVTLTTDIGEEYAAQVKGALYRRLPPGSVVDLALNLTAHRVAEAAFLLRWMAAGFPPGTIHLAIVDPGVGGSRAPIAIRCAEGSFLVGPDNGLLLPLARVLGRPKAVRLDPGLVGLDGPVSATFEGRDLFAPAVVRLAEGTPLDKLGRAMTPERLSLPRPRLTPEALRGEILHIDRFGNAITNIPGDRRLAPGTVWSMQLGKRPRRSVPAVRTYEELPAGAVGILVSSYGLIELCARESSASRRLGTHVGDAVVLRPAERVESMC
jgi:S-adenosylmethionine hydrolase